MVAGVRKQETEDVTDLPEGFKMTELGPLPEEWNVVRLGSVALLRQGRTPRRAQYDDKRGQRIIKVKDFEDGGNASVTPTGDRSFVTVDIGASYRLRAGDVLILNSGHSSAVVGQKVGIVPRELDASFFVAELTAIRSVDQLSDPYFLFACLMLPALREVIRGLVKGGHLYINQLKSMPIPLPPLPEQRAIAHVLRIVQQAKEATERVIEATRELKKSLMRHLFTYGPVPVGEAERIPLKQTDLGSVPEHWRVVRLGDLADLVNGRAFKASEWKRHGLPIIRIQNLNDPTAPFNYFDGPVDPKHLVEPGALLFSWSGSKGTSFGPHLWNGPVAVLNQHIFKIVIKGPEAIERDFLYYSLKRLTDVIEGKTYGLAALVHVRKGDLQSTAVPLPALAEQREIARILRAVDKKLQAEDARKQALDALFKTLLHNLMIGQLRVRYLWPAQPEVVV